MGLLSFIALSNDLYKIREFAEKSMGFECVMFGNQYFRLTSGKDKEMDRNNVETMQILVKKAKKIILNRIYLTWEILDVIYKDPKSYLSLEGI